MTILMTPFKLLSEAEAFAADALSRGCGTCLLPTAGGFVVQTWDRGAA